MVEKTPAADHAALAARQRAANLQAVTEINAKGGLLGRKIEMIERDDEAKNERGVQIAQELINKEKVVATVGYINSGVALASQRFYQEAFDKFLNGTYAGAYEEKLIAEFEKYLPEKPTWKY